MDRNGGKLPKSKEEWRTQLEKAKLKTRKQKLQRAINESPFGDANLIAGYDLSAHKRKQKRKIKRLLLC